MDRPVWYVKELESEMTELASRSSECGCVVWWRSEIGDPKLDLRQKRVVIQDCTPPNSKNSPSFDFKENKA